MVMSFFGLFLASFRESDMFSRSAATDVLITVAVAHIAQQELGNL